MEVDSVNFRILDIKIDDNGVMFIDDNGAAVYNVRFSALVNMRSVCSNQIVEESLE